MISIILVEYKRPDFTRTCIESLYQTTYKDKEIIVINNSQNNIGLAVASNKGAKQAKGEYLFFLNNDTLVKEDIFERLLEHKDPTHLYGYNVLGCRMFNYDGTKELDSALSVDRFGCPAGKTGRMFYPDGAIFIEKSVFDEIGGFDEKLFLYGEDKDLCWRIWLAGYSVSYCDSAIFYHASTSVCNPQVSRQEGFDTNYFRRRLSERNIIRSMLKNYSLGSLFRILPQYIFWSMLEIGLILLTNPKAIWKSYLPAYWWNIVNLEDTIRARKKVIHKVADKDVPFSKAIGKLFVLKTMGVPRWEKERL